jgi:hypothetical protein
MQCPPPPRAARTHGGCHLSFCSSRKRRRNDHLHHQRKQYDQYRAKSGSFARGVNDSNCNNSSSTSSNTNINISSSSSKSESDNNSDNSSDTDSSSSSSNNIISIHDVDICVHRTDACTLRCCCVTVVVFVVVNLFFICLCSHSLCFVFSSRWIKR